MMFRPLCGVSCVFLLACATPESPVGPSDQDVQKDILNANPSPNELANAKPSSPAKTMAEKPAGQPENLEVWHPTISGIAEAYVSWGRVDDEMRFAPFLCRLPQPGNLLLSKSGDAKTHGQKIYSLYAFDPVAYGAPPSMMMLPPSSKPDSKAKPLAIKQAIVKEAFRPKQVESMHHNIHQPKPAVKDGKFYDKGEKAGLYVMFQPKETSPDQATDAGWVYGTISPEGQVTSAGQVKNCMGCHQKNPKRVFGMAKKVGIAPQAHGPNGEKVPNQPNQLNQAPTPTNR